MIKVRMLLKRQGRDEYDFETEIVKPRIGEIVSIETDHYEIKFIQYMFDEDKKFKHLLVTAIIL